MSKKIAIVISFIFLVVFIASCKRVPFHSQMTATLQPPSIPPITGVPSSTNPSHVAITAMPTPTLGIYLSALPSGSYVLYEKRSSVEGYDFDLEILSLDGSFQRTLIQLRNQLVMFSSDQSRLIILGTTSILESFSILDSDPFMLNILTNQAENVPPLLSDCFSLSYAPVQESWVGQCYDGAPNDIYYGSGSNSVRLTDCFSLEDSCGMPQWSPDGQWISYFRSHAAAGGENEYYGFYLMNTSCLTKPETCKNIASGPFRVLGEYGWSPDSKYIASGSLERNDRIHIYKLINGNLVLEKELAQTTISIGDSLAWSPDGQNIVYNSGRDLYIVNLFNGKQRLIIQSDADLNIIGVFQLSPKLTP